MSQQAGYHRWVRGFVDYGGLIAFAGAFFLKLRLAPGEGPFGWTLLMGGDVPRDLTTATWWLVAVSALALLVGWLVEKRLAVIPLVAGGFAVVFGSLTLFFNDPVFIKIKPTIVNLLFGGGLLGGLAIGRNPIRLLLGPSLSMPAEAWRTLTIRYAVFFFGAAVLNEAVWRTQPDDVWVLFRFPGLLVLTVLFSIAQVPLMMKHMKAEDADPPTPPLS